MERLFSLLTLLLFGYGIRAQELAKADLIIANGKIINMDNGSFVEQGHVVIKDGSIIDITNDINNYTAKQVLDASGKFLMPGLWDMHMHFGGGDTTLSENKDFLSLYIAHGVTSIRDMAADISNSVVQWRDEVNNNQLTGPRIFTSGPKLEGYKPVWRGVLEVGTPKEVEQALDSLQRLGVDFVKITENTLKPDIYLYALKAVKSKGLKSSAHIPSTLSLKEVIDAGLNSVEHVSYAYNAGVPEAPYYFKLRQEEKLTSQQLSDSLNQHFHKDYAQKQYRYMAQKNVFITPTLLGSYIIAHLDENSHADDEYLKYIGQGIKNTYSWRVDRAKNVDPETIKERHAHYERVSKILPVLQEQGVKIMAGTDAGYLNSFVYPGIGIHEELALMVKAGLTPLQALRASVVNSPQFLGLTEYGAIGKGKRADLILLEKNPIEDISATRNIHTVIVNGKVFDRPQLDKLLQDVAAKNVSDR